MTDIIEYVIFVVEGGIGKNIMATVPLRGLKTKYKDKKIIVVASWPDIFKFNPNVYRTFRLGNTPNFYDDYINGHRSLIFKVESYYHNDYINPPEEPKHLTQLWCEMLDVPFDNSEPELFFTKQELAMGKSYCENKDKPVLAIQYQGGQVITQQNQVKIKQFVRTLPLDTVRTIIDDMKNTHHIMSVQAKEQHHWDDVEFTNCSIRQAMTVIPFVDKIFSIDSMVQHVAAAFDKKAVVCWGATNPKLLGYEKHHNITREVCKTPMCHRPNSYLFDVSYDGQLWDCPYSDACMDHDAQEILKILKED